MSAAGAVNNLKRTICHPTDNTNISVGFSTFLNQPGMENNSIAKLIFSNISHVLHFTSSKKLLNIFENKILS